MLATPQGAHNIMFGMSGCAWWLANACAAWAIVAMSRGQVLAATLLGLEPATVGRAEWLEERRLELQERMRRRRSSYNSSGGGFLHGFAVN